MRLGLEHQGEYPSPWAAITSIAAKCGMTAETLRTWVRGAEVDAGARAGLSSDERERLKLLERENRELRRANEILKGGVGFFRVNVTMRAPGGFARFFAAPPMWWLVPELRPVRHRVGVT